MSERNEKVGTNSWSGTSKALPTGECTLPRAIYALTGALGRGLLLGESLKTLTARCPYGMGTAGRDKRTTFTIKIKEVFEKIRYGQHLSPQN
ncbi:MAG: hypothetical protein ACE5JQ_01250 [Candidatus Methylomirabilales bacterium]